MSADKYLGKLVVARTAQGELISLGICHSYCDAPTLMIEDQEGKRTHWRADLCEVLNLPKDVMDAITYTTAVASDATTASPRD